ncbi:unnamed protein product [Meloidogyne enterolobii]|uniref:Uncharacterized protein n=1 Tax=Meloidogyne enterolobii TaxID=390850 RepID=A0ACB0Y8Q5_MELEN
MYLSTFINSVSPMTSPSNMPSTPINPQVQHYMLQQYPHQEPPYSPHMVPPMPVYSEVHHHILPQYTHPSYPHPQQLPHPQYPPHQHPPQLTVINHHYHIHPQPVIQVPGQMPNMPVQQQQPFHYPLHGHSQIMPTPLLYPVSDPNVDLSLTIPKERLILTQDETSQPPNLSHRPGKFQLNNIK